MSPDASTRRYRSATVRFYFDADVLGVAHALVRFRSDVTYPGDPGGAVHKRMRPPCLIESPAVRDSEWIPQVAGQGWLIITRDSRIQEHTAEISAVRDNGARMVALAGPSARTTFEQLEVLMSQWRRIERCSSEPGPSIYRATRTSFRSIVL